MCDSSPPFARSGARRFLLPAVLIAHALLTEEATCYKLFLTADLRRIDLPCERFEFYPEVTPTAGRLGLRIQEIPIS